jgi:hypothetical protein
MLVYVAWSGHPLDKKTKRPTLAAVCIPQKILGHLPGLFFKIKERFYGRDIVKIDPDEIFTPENYEELRKPASRRDLNILRKLDLIDKIFHHLVADPILKPIKIFGVVVDVPQTGFIYKQPGALPSDWYFLLQRIDRLEEKESGSEDGAILYLEEESPEFRDPNFIQDFSQNIYTLRKNPLPQFKYINPALQKAKADLQSTAGLVLAKLVATVIRLTYEAGLGWEGDFNTERGWISSISTDPFLSAIDNYYMAIASKIPDYEKENGKDKLYGLFLMKADKFKPAL